MWIDQSICALPGNKGHSMSNYQDLLAKKKAALEKEAADLEKQLQDARRAERAGVITQIKSCPQPNTA